MRLLYIAVGGALGSVLRYLAWLGVRRLPPANMPWGTLVVNIIGAFALGCAMAFFASRGKLDSDLRVGITVGCLGGFTTYSAFAYDMVSLFSERQLGVLVAYVVGMLGVSIAACVAGIAIGRALAG